MAEWSGNGLQNRQGRFDPCNLRHIDGATMIEVIVTKHAAQRLKERLGIKRKAVIRHAQMAFTQGKTPSDAQPNDYTIWLTHRQSLNNKIMYIVYKQWVYIFSLCNDKQVPKLITVYPLDKVEQEDQDIYLGGKLHYA